MSTGVRELDEPAVAASVIIVNYHAYPELTACLESLERQTLPSIEIIVVDHDSDATGASAVSQKFPTVRLVPIAANPGFAAGVNRGAALARGQYLWLLNPDAVAEPDACRTLVDWMNAHADVGIAGSLVRDADGRIQGSARRFPGFTTSIAGRASWLTRLCPGNPLSRMNVLTGPGVTAPVDVDWVSGASMMVRRDAFVAVSGMDEGFFLYWEDADLCLRLKRAGWRTVYCPLASITHLCGRSSRSSPASIVAFHRSAYRYFTKHAGAALRLARPLVYAGLTLRMRALLLLNERTAPDGPRP
jgi:N-acetylglucosaminyl-diphospho-decaprenol L-rhamnosyltransferase